MLRISLQRLNLSAPRLSPTSLVRPTTCGRLGATVQLLSTSNGRNNSEFRQGASNNCSKELLSKKSNNNNGMTINEKSLPKITIQNRRLAGTSAGKYAPAPSVSAVPLREHNGNIYSNSDSDRECDLPSLPVAELEQTMEKLKESLAPFAMNSHEYAETLELIDEFQSSAGIKLSLLLNEKARQTKNWMSHDWWQQEAYLKCRSSLMINSNPAMIYPKLPDNIAKDGRQNVNKFLAHLISAFMDCREALRMGTSLETTTATKQCLDQYTKIFGSTRIPVLNGIDTMHIKDVNDILETFKIVVSHKNRFYQLDLDNTTASLVGSACEEEGATLMQQRLDTIQRALEIIQVNSSLDDNQMNINNENHHHEVRVKSTRPVGIFTSLPRDYWAHVYPLLDGDALQAIDDAQFVVCLDSVKDEHRIQSFLDDSTHHQVLGKHILYADNENIGNRWFDKTLQVIVITDDKVEKLLGAGINYEHTVAEAGCISKIIEYTHEKVKSSFLVEQKELSRNELVFDSITQANAITSKPKNDKLLSTDHSTIRQLSMYEDSDCADLDAKLHEVKQHYDISTSHLDLEVLKFTHYGKRAIKSWNFSPDSWIQVALSLAYYNLHGRLGPCYESVSLRKFAFGRTETMRSLTPEVAQFCMQPNYDRLRLAITAHNYLARSASDGQGIDRVLLGYQLAFNEIVSGQWRWGLRLDSEKYHSKIAFDNGNIFSDDDIRVIKNFMSNKLIQRSKRFVLSTSQVSSIYPDTFLTYGPLVPEGYGCCYNPNNNQIVVAITADTSNPSISCSPSKYKAILEESLLQMRDLLDQNYISNSKL